MNWLASKILASGQETQNRLRPMEELLRMGGVEVFVVVLRIKSSLLFQPDYRVSDADVEVLRQIVGRDEFHPSIIDETIDVARRVLDFLGAPQRKRRERP